MKTNLQEGTSRSLKEYYDLLTTKFAYSQKIVQDYRLQRMDMTNKDKPMTEYRPGGLVYPQTSLLNIRSRNFRAIYIWPLAVESMVKNKFVWMLCKWYTFRIYCEWLTNLTKVQYNVNNTYRCTVVTSQNYKLQGNVWTKTKSSSGFVNILFIIYSLRPLFCSSRDIFPTIQEKSDHFMPFCCLVYRLLAWAG